MASNQTKAIEGSGVVQTRICGVCRTVHDLPLCPTRSDEVRASIPEWLQRLNAEAERRYNAVDWQQGKWYAIYDERDEGSIASALLFKCEIDAEGVVYLVGDQCEYDRQGGHEPDVYEARGYITSGSVVVLQS